MKKEHIFFIIIFLFTVLSFYLFYRIISPFLGPIVWAILLSIIFYPLFQKLQHLLKKKEAVSAMIMTLLVVIVIVLPAGLLTVSLANEVVDAYHSLEEMIKTGRLQAYLEQFRQFTLFQWVWTRLDQYLDLSQADPFKFLLQNVRQIGTFLFNQTTVIFRGLSTFVIGFFFALLSLYYFFKDGNRLLERLKAIAPIPSKERELILLRFKDMIYATIYGGIVVAIVQGSLGGLIFWILGISSPILWGTAMALLSFIPVGGTALVWVPTSLLFVIEGNFLKALILFLFGVLVISMVDNLLRPKLISSKTNIHPLLLFFSVLGGIQAFGMIGLVAGPLITTLCLTLIEIYAGGIR
jgi:predicted PurR-regulated permease PerM